MGGARYLCGLGSIRRVSNPRATRKSQVSWAGGGFLTIDRPLLSVNAKRESSSAAVPP